MMSLFSRWRQWQEGRQRIMEDAAAYHRLLADIQDLLKYCRDFEQVEATASWLVHRDSVHRSGNNIRPGPGSEWWGPVNSFRGQLRARSLRNRNRS